MTVAEVVGYMRDKQGIEVTRHTVYNWMRKGVNNETLQHTTVPNKKWITQNVCVTTKEWLHDFFRRIGKPLASDQPAGDRA